MACCLAVRIGSSPEFSRVTGTNGSLALWDNHHGEMFLRIATSSCFNLFGGISSRIVKSYDIPMPGLQSFLVVKSFSFRFFFCVICNLSNFGQSFVRSKFAI